MLREKLHPSKLLARHRVDDQFKTGTAGSLEHALATFQITLLFRCQLLWWRRVSCAAACEGDGAEQKKSAARKKLVRRARGSEASGGK